MTRNVKTPAQRAQEVVDVLDRRLTKLQKQKRDLEKEARALTPEVEAVEKRLAYAKQNPDLPTAPAEKSITTGGTAR